MRGGLWLSSDETISVENGTDMLLVLLHAGGKTKPEDEEIVGITKLGKLVFLLKNETVLAKYLNDFSYEAYNYGPYSSEVFDSLQALINAGLVRTRKGESSGYIEESDRYEIEEQANSENMAGIGKTTIYELTDEGRTVATALMQSLSDDERKEIENIKKKFNSIDLKQLLRYVYTKYPESTTESVIRDEVLY